MRITFRLRYAIVTASAAIIILLRGLSLRPWSSAARPPFITFDESHNLSNASCCLCELVQPSELHNSHWCRTGELHRDCDIAIIIPVVQLQVTTFRSAIRSVHRSMSGECAIWFYLVFDFDLPSQTELAQLARVYRKTFGSKAGEEKLRFVLNKVARTYVHAVNQAALRATLDGRGYMFALGDDNEFDINLASGWDITFVRTVQQFGNVGAVGPMQSPNATPILQHAFVAKEHICMFGYFFPWELPDWYTGDWITLSYAEVGSMRQFSSIVVQNRVGSRDGEGRYELNRSHDNRCFDSARKASKDLASLMSCRRVQQASVMLPGGSALSSDTSIYRSGAYMLAGEAGHTDFPEEFQVERVCSTLAGAPEGSFNPSLAVLPYSFARRLHRNAYFVAVVRHRGDQCFLKNASRVKQIRRKGLPGSSVILLDHRFTPISHGYLAEGRYVSDCEDVKVYAFDQHLIITCMKYYEKNPQNGVLHIYELELHVYGRVETFPGYLNATVVNLTPGILRQTVNGWFGPRNLGFVPRSVVGVNVTRLAILWWLSSPYVDIRPGLADPYLISERWHGNGSPVELPWLNAFLAIGHSHAKGGTLSFYGERYFHFFILFQNAPPYKLLRISKPFCFPSSHNRSLCEFIQVVGALILNKTVEGLQLLIPYGINDCESAVARVPLETALRFARGDRTSTAQTIETVQGASAIVLRHSLRPDDNDNGVSYYYYDYYE